MRALVLPASCVVLAVGFFTAAQSVPLPRAASPVAAEAPVEQVSRLAGRADVEQMLASGRAPVPWVRERKLEPYTPPQKEAAPAVASAVAPAVAPTAAVAARAQAPVVTPVVVAARPVYRMTVETQWRATVTSGSTALAVTATP